MSDSTDETEIIRPVLSYEVMFAALELVGEAVVVVDNVGTILYANDQATLMLGYARSDMMGNKVEMLLPDDLKPVHPRHRSGYLDNPTRRPMGSGLSLQARHQTGRLLDVEINLLPRLWPGLGVITGALLIRKGSVRSSDMPPSAASDLLVRRADVNTD